MPTPNKGERKDDWMSRCMGDPDSNKSFPDQAQRAAVCYSKWTQHGGKDKVDAARAILAMEQGAEFNAITDAEKALKKEVMAIRKKYIDE